MKTLSHFFPGKLGGVYWEPFLGGGSVFFAFAQRISEAVLSDANADLMAAYKAVKDDVGSLCERMREHERRHLESSPSRDYYYEVRDVSPDGELETAARFLFLNKTCYNGLYRVNRDGDFNVPYGWSGVAVCDETALVKASHALKSAVLKHGSFDKVVRPGTGDFVYCDPPYDGGFTSYTKSDFKEKDQRLLAKCARAWKNAGAHVVASNSDTDLIRSLYGENFNLHAAYAPRTINRDGKGRGRVRELIITGDERNRSLPLMGS